MANCYISIVITYDIEELPCDVPDNLKLKFMVIDNGIANSTGSDFRSLSVLLLLKLELCCLFAFSSCGFLLPENE